MRRRSVLKQSGSRAAAPLDILWSDGKITKGIRPTSAGATPIGLCIAAADFFGDGMARFMSLKYMSFKTPDTGSYSLGYYFNEKGIRIVWGNNAVDTPVTNIEVMYSDVTDSPLYLSDISTSTPSIPTLTNSAGTLNTAELGAINQTAVTDIDGKNKTAILVNAATAQSDWRTADTITNSTDEGYYPAACCCWRYCPDGTSQGDWYLPACGELAKVGVQRDAINEKLSSIKSVYSTSCIDSLSGYRWSSTEYSSLSAMTVTGSVSRDNKHNEFLVIAMLAI